MYYKLKKGCFIRKYGEYGYITSTGIYNDQLFNESGAAFLFALSKNAQSLHNIASKIVENFIDVSVDDIIQDVEDFLLHLEEDGFIVSGRTAEECENKDVGFRYEIEPVIKSIEDFSPIHKRTTTGTQELLRKQLLKQPQIGSFQIEITSKCNERCVHCYIPHEYKVDNISPNLFYKTLDELSNMGVINVTLSGGEPMTHPNFIEFLKAAKSYDFNVGVLSNLTLLTDEMVEIMKTGNTSFVQVSLYSMIPEHHDAITTVKGSFEKTKNAILKLIANNIPVQISCPVMSINKNDYVDVAKWAHEHKIRSETDYAIMANSFMLICDAVSAIDPIYSSVSDSNNCAKLNYGVAFEKYVGYGGKCGTNDANPRYIASIRNFLDSHQIFFQFAEFGKVDQGGGGTTAYIAAKQNIEVMDCGIPMLNMHSPMEIIAKADLYEAYQFYKLFFSFSIK